jgi:L-seryl-tRNA(Ser) seleniumtransferase/D-glucosaminate-6-phosphate ammonia-lyase
VSSIALPRIINAAGHLSMLGGGVSEPALAHLVASAIEDAMTHPVDMAWLKDEASRRIAAATGAETGCVTTGAAAGIALSAAACVAGSSIEMVHAVPYVPPRRVVIMSGHDIDFGAPVLQMVALGGGSPVIAGANGNVTENDLRQCIEGVAAFVYVQSHHTRPGDRPSLETALAVAREAGVPTIIDAAAEEDLRRYIALGADLVIYSGGKALGGISSSGLVAGRAPLVAAIRAHERGIGRAMKVGPEQLLSVCIALDLYRPASRDDTPVLESLLAACSAIPGISASISTDPARATIRRVRITTPLAAPLARTLRENDPPIYVRAHHVAEGYFDLDPRNLALSDIAPIAGATAAAMRALESKIENRES